MIIYISSLTHAALGLSLVESGVLDFSVVVEGGFVHGRLNLRRWWSSNTTKEATEKRTGWVHTRT